MTRVLVLGGTGLLGRELLPRLAAAGHAVRATSRRPRPPSPQDAVEWVQVDLGTGAGLSAALAGMDAVIHAAQSTVRQSVNVGGIDRLLEEAERAGIANLLYPSIVGIERAPGSYYRQKVLAEERIVRGSVPWTILRATQFHSLIDRWLGIAARLPIMPVPTRRSER